MSDDPLWTDRRTVLGTVGAGTVLALAGCTGEDADDDEAPTGDEEDDGADGDTGDQDDTDDEDDTGESVEPMAFPEEECAVCNMIAADHPDWNAQLVHENEQRQYFCSSGCLTAYSADPPHFGGPDSAVDAAWVTGYESGDLIDVTEASFVRITDANDVDDVMMMNPTPFERRADAEAFIEDFEKYDAEDIIEWDSFDRELALLYRSKFFDDE